MSEDSHSISMRNPLSILQAGRAFVRLTLDPNRLNEVFNLSDSLVSPEVGAIMVAHVAKDERGAAALRDRPTVRLALDELKQLPVGTLGRTYADLMIANGLDPKDIPALPAPDDAAYVRAHLYETHDLWHAATGFRTDVAGELGLQAFYAAQLPGKLPTAILAMGMLNTLLFSFDDQDARMREIARGWLLGRRSRPLFGARWNELLPLPLDEARARLGLDLAAVDGALPAQSLRAAA
jgi:ubiquinone biosynthesis protein COQ4